MTIRRHFTLLLLVVLLGSFSSTGFCAAKKIKAKQPSSPRDLFLEAEHAFEQKKLSKFYSLMSRLEDYPLYPYLLHKKLANDIYEGKENENDIKEFIKDYADSPLSESLQTIWLYSLGAKENWQKFLDVYQEPSEENTRLTCLAIWAKYNQTNDETILKEALPLWMSSQTQDRSCTRIYDVLHHKGTLSYHAIWERIELAFKNKNSSLASSLSKYIPHSELKWLHLWHKVHENPSFVEEVREFDDFEPDNYLVNRILTHGILKLARKDAESAANSFEKLSKDHYFNERQRGAMLHDIAIQLAKRKSFKTSKYIDKVPEGFQDSEFRAWHIRYCLYIQNWHRALNALNELTPHEMKEPRWQYWKARTLEELDNTEEAQILYKKIMKERNYYAFLSSEKLNQPIHINNHSKSMSEQAMNRIRHLNGVERTKELLALSRPYQAKREWFYTLNRLPEHDKALAGKYAHLMKWHDLAIFTMSKIENKDDLTVRFPLAHQNKIVNEAKKHAVDPAWIFALTRQESAFVPNCESPRGALGLMQLLPTTAKELAHKLKMKNKAQIDLTNPHTNIELGTAYLKGLHNNLGGHPILATASYNAGPGKIKQWLPPSPIDADIWIENIPYEETRDYVQNIVTYIGIYRALMGRPTDLKEMLSPIIPG